jgi:putative DNA primase/helicase
MVKDARDKYCISNEDLDKDSDLLNLQNGTLNLKTFEFREHRAEDLLSKIANVSYNPAARSELWQHFINEVMQGDEEKIKYLQKAIGYGITADTSLETCFILYGATTRNGKSTLVETIMHMLGGSSGYAMQMKPESLAQKQNNDSRQANGDIARLAGARFLNVSEPPKKMIFDAALLKTLLGRDSIVARHLHEREFEFDPMFKLFMNTN